MKTLRRQPTAGLAVLVLWASAARADEAPAELRHAPVAVELRNCEPSLAVEIRRILGVELRATIVDAAEGRDPVTRVVAACRDAEVELLLGGTASATPTERRVALTEAVPTGRARLVALAIAELVAASWQESEAPAEPAKPVLPPQPPQSPPEPGVSEHARALNPEISVMVEGLGIVRAFPGSELWLLGTGARAVCTPIRPLRLTLETTIEWGSVSRSTGRVTARVMGGALGLGWGIERSWAFLMPWLGARGGVARLTGEPSADATTGESQSGLWLGPELGMAASLFPRAAVHVTLALSAGALLRGVQGKVADDRDVDVRGLWAGLMVGVGLTKP